MGCPAGGLLLVYLLVRYFRPTLFYKGWQTLQPTYGLATDTPPEGVVLHRTSLRVGVEHYNQTADVGLGPAGLYLRRPAPTACQLLLYLPYAQLQLQSLPGRTGPLGAPVYGIFEVAGAELWLDAPYATSLIAHLAPPAPRAATALTTAFAASRTTALTACYLREAWQFLGWLRRAAEPAAQHKACYLSLPVAPYRVDERLVGQRRPAGQQEARAGKQLRGQQAHHLR